MLYAEQSSRLRSIGVSRYPVLKYSGHGHYVCAVRHQTVMAYAKRAHVVDFSDEIDVAVR